MLWAFDDAPASLSSPERFVLLAIADHVDDATGDAWPSIARIARRTGLSRTSVKAAVRILSELGVIDVVDQGAPVARAETRPNLYRWHPDQLRLGLDVRTRRVGGRSRRVVEPVDGPAQPGDKEGVASRPGSPADREGVASRPGGGRQPTPNPHRTLTTPAGRCLRTIGAAPTPHDDRWAVRGDDLTCRQAGKVAAQRHGGSCVAGSWTVTAGAARSKAADSTPTQSDTWTRWPKVTRSWPNPIAFGPSVGHTTSQAAQP
jgi:hypothetical protein